MCGIVGAIAGRNVVPVLTEGLKRLEYRGYDSAGIAILDGSMRRVRRIGRVSEMEAAVRAENLAESIACLGFVDLARCFQGGSYLITPPVNLF